MKIPEAIRILRRSNIQLRQYMDEILPLAESRENPTVMKGYETQKKCEAELQAVGLAIEALEKMKKGFKTNRRRAGL